MFKTRLVLQRALAALFFAMGMIINVHAETIAAGTVVTVRTDTDIDAKDTGNGRVYSGVVDKDVYDGDNRTAIPRGSDVELMPLSSPAESARTRPRFAPGSATVWNGWA